MFEDRGLAPPEPGEGTCEDSWSLPQPLLVHGPWDAAGLNPEAGERGGTSSLKLSV